jgi:hypothetical protein
MVAMLKWSCPAQPPVKKFVQLNAGNTTAMNTKSSTTASSVTATSTVAAMCTPTILSATNKT